MAEAKKKSGTAAPKKAAEPVATEEVAEPAGPVDQKMVVDVKNISGGIINTSKGMIESGETGKATIRELKSLNKFLEKA